MKSPRDSSSLTGEQLRPMEAVGALFGAGRDETARAVVASLSQSVFEAPPPRPSNLVRRALARMVWRLMQGTTRTEKRTGPDGREVLGYRNRILERSGHPYAVTLLEPSRADTHDFVEGGDPMNAIYMMLCPEIRKQAGPWDHIILDSVQARDVQLRFVWETRCTRDLAMARIERGESVRLKAVAAGAGLSLILVLERLLREGSDPALITAVISDREAANMAKSSRLLGKLEATRQLLESGRVRTVTEDLLSPSESSPNDVITVMGILEYFPGHTFTTTERHLGHPEPQDIPGAEEIVRNVAAMTTPGGRLVTNTFRLISAVRIMEVFGKKFRYRGRPEMQRLLAGAGFVPAGRHHSGHIFDVEIFEKRA
ncbi:MAG: hypothetical protein ACO3YO_00980 [Chthoniobacterales bacterium]|jgi:hypothetical protein